MNDAHAELLLELKRVRAILTGRQEALGGMAQSQADPAMLEKAHQEVNDLSEMCMTLAARLWRVTREERNAEGAAAAALPLNRNAARGV